MKWITFFSRTGSEIARLIHYFNRYPDVIVTDNTNPETWDEDMVELFDDVKNFKEWRQFKTQPKEKKIELYKSVLDKNAIITLHGWLNIVPKEICESFAIYNGHPGLITHYPELKGKDPAEKVLQNIKQYDKIGSVLHRVIPEVDSGEILISESVDLSHNRDYNIIEIYQILQRTSFQTWIKFLTPFFNE